MKLRRTGLAAAITSLVAGGLFAPASWAATAGDAFAEAIPITSVPAALAGDTTGSTTEAGEPEPSCSWDPGSTVWFRYDAAAGEALRVTTAGSDFDTVVAIFTGDDLGSLTEVACNDDAGWSLQSTVSFGSPVATTYFIQLSGYAADQGAYELALEVRHPPANDLFAGATELSGAEFLVHGDGTDATLEPGEPAQGCGYDVVSTTWHRFTAPSAGLLRARVTETHAVLTAMRGSDLGSLEEVACDHDTYDLRLAVDAGETVYLRVAFHDWDGAGAPYVLTGSITAHPANDEVTSAEPIDSLGQLVTGDNDGATDAPGEPICAYGRGGVWYRFTAPETGSLVATTAGSELDTTVGVFVQRPDGSLNLLACSDQAAHVADSSATGWIANAGTTYLIKVAGWYGTAGTFRLSVERGAAIETYDAGAVAAHGDERTEVGAAAGGWPAGAGIHHRDDRSADESETTACAIAVYGVCTRV